MIRGVSTYSIRDASMLQERCSGDTWIAYQCITWEPRSPLAHHHGPLPLLTMIGKQIGCSRWRVGPYHVLCCDAATADGPAWRLEAGGVPRSRSPV